MKKRIYESFCRKLARYVTYEMIQMKILAAIVTYNRCTLLSRCIDHLQAQARQAQEILVINNASTDGTVEMLKQRNISFVTQENVGSAGGWHRGIQYAIDHGFDAVWLMDDDGFPDAGALVASGVASSNASLRRIRLPRTRWRRYDNPSAPPATS